MTKKSMAFMFGLKFRQTREVPIIRIQKIIEQVRKQIFSKILQISTSIKAFN